MSIADLLEKIVLPNCRSVSTPISSCKKFKLDGETSLIDFGVYKSMVGSLLFLSVTRSDILFSVNLMSRFMRAPTESHFRSEKKFEVFERDCWY